MNIAVLGATGMAGSRIVDEALSRGHAVTGFARKVSGAAQRERLELVAADVAEPNISDRFRNHDVVVGALRFIDVSAPVIIGAAKKAAIRLAMVGGAGSLYVAPGIRLIDTPQFPPAYKPEASAGQDFLSALLAEENLDWTFLSPSALFSPGTRTGRFRLGTDELLVAADGTSSISAEDYAIAMLDELERPQHRRRRFTVGY